MSDKLKINPKGSLRPKYPSRSFDKRESKISYDATNLSSAPLFYVQPRVNKLWSSLANGPNGPTKQVAILRFGNIYGHLNKTGNIYPNIYPNLNLTVDTKGNYKLLNSEGKQFKVHFDSNGGFVKYNKQKMYL